MVIVLFKSSAIMLCLVKKLILMKVLKAVKFDIYKQLVEFVAEHNIQREDIFMITETTMHYTFFYYALA